MNPQINSDNRAIAPSTPDGTENREAPRRGMIGQLFGSRSFVAAFVVLLLAAVGLNAAVSHLQLHFKKEAVPMRGDFQRDMPEVLGPWVQVAREDTLEPDVQHALATDQFLFCSYVNSRALNKTPDAIRKEFGALPVPKQKVRLNEYRERDPASVVNIALTYYTGKADTVAHVPERCYIGDGYDPVDPQDVVWSLPRLNRRLDVRYISFQSQRSAGAPPSNVAYFFQVNGRYTSDSLTVRAELQNLFNRYGYYAKVETMCINPDRAAAASAIQDLLAYALPEVEKILPDWSQYRSK